MDVSAVGFSLRWHASEAPDIVRLKATCAQLQGRHLWIELSKGYILLSMKRAGGGVIMIGGTGDEIVWTGRQDGL